MSCTAATQASRMRLRCLRRKSASLRGRSVLISAIRKYGASTGRLLGGLLLCAAMERSQAPDEVAAVDSDHLPAAEHLAEDAERPLVCRVVEGGDQHRRVA